LQSSQVGRQDRGEQAGKKAVRAGQNREGRPTSRLGQVFRHAGQSREGRQVRAVSQAGRAEKAGR
jgi:hypothetical protein